MLSLKTLNPSLKKLTNPFPWSPSLKKSFNSSPSTFCKKLLKCIYPSSSRGRGGVYRLCCLTHFVWKHLALHVSFFHVYSSFIHTAMDKFGDKWWLLFLFFRFYEGELENFFFLLMQYLVKTFFSIIKLVFMIDFNLLKIACII